MQEGHGSGLWLEGHRHTAKTFDTQPIHLEGFLLDCPMYHLWRFVSCVEVS